MQSDKFHNNYMFYIFFNTETGYSHVMQLMRRNNENTKDIMLLKMNTNDIYTHTSSDN